MQQRQLRLGDILDDYCPRERRLANHTMVAMVGNDIRLTRCTTCDTEHPYKGGKVPRLRKKKTSVEAAYDEVLESVKQDTPPQAMLVTNPETDEPESPLSDEEAQDAPVHSDNGNAPAADDAGRSPSAPPVDPRAAAAHRARAGRAARARVHDQTGEQAPGAIPEQQLTARPLREERRRRPGWQLARAHGRPGRPPGRRATPRARRTHAPGRRTPPGARRTAEALALVSRFQFLDSRSQILDFSFGDPLCLIFRESTGLSSALPTSDPSHGRSRRRWRSRARASR